jgi:rhomboid protease GluP
MLSRVVPTDIPITGFLLLANFILFALEYLMSGNSLTFSNEATIRLGASLPLPYEIQLHQYWRWCTACFLHGGILHIGFNMWALFDIGPLVEQLYGRAKFLTVYIFTGVVGYIVSSALGHFSLGASGAIFGLLGIMVSYGVRRRDATSRNIRSQALKWAIYALVMSALLPGVDNTAHLGGFFSGMLFGYIVSDEPPLTEGQIRFWSVVQVLVVAFVFGCFFLMARTPIS